MKNSHRPIDRRPTPQQLRAARRKRVPDVIAGGLDVLFVGINPGLYSGALGHHFARPGNRFWRALHDGGFTPCLLSPFEERELIRYGCGITNIAARTTAEAAELSARELRAGARRLEQKLRRYRPGCVALLGLTAYRAAFARPQARLGLQPEPLAGVPVWVLPNPSGLNAHYQRRDFARLFRELRMAARRAS